jgi:hypothetical protein
MTARRQLALHRIPFALLAVAFLLLVPGAAAGLRDPATYPDGIAEVSNTAIQAASDFEVAVRLDVSAEQVTVTVCRFSSLTAAGPDICYMNLAAAQADGAWSASTAAVQHPEWRDGWILGYKVLARTASGELHAPDRLAGNGEPDYYRLVVGEAEVEGSVVVEDGAPAPASQGRAADGIPLPGAFAVAGLAVALWVQLRRRD